MENILSGFIDSILGPSDSGSGSNRKYVCPFHVSNPPGKKKLEIDIITDGEGHNKWGCWVCGQSGRSIHSLFYRMGSSKKNIDALSKIIVRDKDYKNEHEKFNGLLPEEYVFLPDAKPNNIIAKHARLYLKKRRTTEADIYKYQIGFCDDGPYSERIIMPSYDKEGKMNFFIGRSFEPEPYLKYKYPEFSRDIIPFEMFINWELPIILCEGGFDMLAIKRNVIPLLGKSITDVLKKKLISSKVKKIYVVLDKDATKQALSQCEEFLTYGKKVYLVLLESKDPSEMGFVDFTKMIQKSMPLTLNTILQLKMKL